MIAFDICVPQDIFVIVAHSIEPFKEILEDIYKYIKNNEDGKSELLNYIRKSDRAGNNSRTKNNKNLEIHALISRMEACKGWYAPGST